MIFMQSKNKGTKIMFTFGMKLCQEHEFPPTIFTQNSLLKNFKDDSEDDDEEKIDFFKNKKKERSKIARFG